MFCAPGLIFGGAEGALTRFHDLCSRTNFRRCRVCRVSFSCLVLQDSFSAVPRASGPVSCFARPCFHLYRGRRIPFPCSAIPDSFSTVPRVVRSRFHILRVRTHFRRYRVRPIPFSCFPLSDMFSVVSRASGPFFKFCTPELVFDVTVGVRSSFHVLRSRTSIRRYRVRSLFHVLRVQTHFRLYRGHRVPFSCFASSCLFSAVPRASGPIFIFCAPVLVFDGTEGVGTRFYVLRSRTRFRRYRGRPFPFPCFPLPDMFSAVPRASGPFYMFCVPGLVFEGTVGVGSRFHVLRSRTHFRRYRERRVPFSCFARSDGFSAVPRASGPVFMFCVPGLIFGSIDGVVSRFHVLCSRARFQRYRGRRIPFSCFARTDSFSAVPRASCPVFMFCALGLVFSGIEGVGSHFLVLRYRTRFRRYRGR
jgi:hypothetical protein